MTGGRARFFTWTATAAVALGLALPGAAGAYVSNLGVSYDIDSPPAPSPASQNQLDVYGPEGASGPRPVVVFVHGGGWAIGDKANQVQDKATLFTTAGYVFASVNYRLSPATAPPYPADRVRFPAHPHDVGEAVGWIHRNIGAYGGDPDRIVLIGHSAGAQIAALVGTFPTTPAPGYLADYGVGRADLLGVVSLDTDAFDVAGRIAELPAGSKPTFYNAFATPEENAVDDSWRIASPIAWAGRSDPPFHLVTQAGNTDRMADNTALASALGQDPSEAVLAVPYDHAGINDALGAPGEAVETPSVMSFVASLVKASHPPKVRVKGPRRRAIATPGRRAKLKLRFSAKGRPLFECRVGKGRYKRCSSPHTLRLKTGTRNVAVRATGRVRGKAVGSPGKPAKLRILVKHRGT